jgi:4-amino-4-deoxy-L-arabinose transferase-like glycosyltransferase
MKTTTLDSDRKTSFFNDRYIWILLIISISVRIYLGFFTYVIKNDSVAFIQNAKYFADGDFLSGLRHDFHPLYSFLMAVLYKAIPDMELSGTIVSISFGTLTVIVFYLIGKSVFGRKVSFVSSVVLALHPYAVRFSVDIISESTYFFFFISALGLGFFAIVKRKYYLFALAGISSAFAYLVRPEGIGIIIIVAGWCILKDLTKFKIVWKEKLVSVLILATSFLVFSMPYLVYIQKETGHWSLTKKKDLSKVVGIDVVLSSGNGKNLKKEKGDGYTKKKNVSQAAKTIAKLNKQGSDKSTTSSDKKITKQNTHVRIDLKKLKIDVNSILYILDKYLTTFHPFLFVLLIIGVIKWTRVRKVRYFGFYIASIIVFYLLVFYRLNLAYAPAFHYPSRRHLIPLVIPAIFCVGIGVYATGSWIHEKFQFDKLKSGLRGRLRNVWIAQLLILIIIISVLLPKTLKPQRSDKLGIKKAGQWIRENSHIQSPAILSDSFRNAYYAGGKHVHIERIEQAINLAREKKPDYMLITYREYMVIEEELLQLVKDKKIALVYKYPEKKSLNRRNVLLFKILH